MKSKNLESQKSLTEVELEMMNIIWSIGPCSVHQVISTLPEERKLAYTSVSTIVRILEQKGFVESKKDGRGFLYNALVKKEDYEQSAVQQIVTKLFQGAPTDLVKTLINTNSLTEKDLIEIKNLISQRL